MIPFLDLARLHDSIRAELDAAFDRVVRGSAFIGGKELAAFEDAFADAHHAPAAAGCASGTDALALTLRALGVGPGDEVIVPSMTFVATAEAVVHAGATPVIADVDPVTALLTPASVAAVRSERTRAVVPVHLYGHPVPFDDLRAWRDSGLLVVEDAAQAHLATCDGELVGTIGDAACFSFYPGKNLGALGDGGAVISRDTALVGAVKHLRDHGRSTKYEHDAIGYCSRLDGMQAAFLAVKLAHLPEWTARRRALADRYAANLAGGTLVPWAQGAVHHLLVARLADRERIQQALHESGVETGIHYPLALSQQPALRAWWRNTPHAEAVAASVLSLPMDPFMTEVEVDTVCSALIAVL